MEVSTLEHPSADKLRRFAQGMLEDEITERVGDHVEHCDRCAEQIEDLTVDPESLIFHAALTSSATQRPPEISSAAISDDGRLELHDLIGSGGMGAVYRAWQPSVNRFVAVKQLHVPLPQDDSNALRTRERFQREIRALGRVRHPHLARIYTSGVTQDGRLFYSMELINGANLSAVFRALTAQVDEPSGQCSWHAAVKAACAKTPGSRRTTAEVACNATPRSDHRSLTAQSTTENLKSVDRGTSEQDVPNANDTGKEYVRIAVDIVRQIALAVEVLHDAGIVHRDIKPGNIMVNSQGDHATLMDLGLAGLIDDQETRLTRTGLIAGSLPYISPEQFQGDRSSKSGDIYNLGVVLWELLTLRRLFRCTTNSSEAELMNRILHDDADSVRAHRPEVTPDLEAVVLKCLEKQPAMRYSSVREFIADLDRVIDGQRVIANRRDVMFRIRSILQHRRSLVFWTLGLFACQVVLLAAYGKHRDSAPLSEHLPAINDASTTSISASTRALTPVINDGSLVAWWSGEVSGSMATDSSPNGNNGALIGDTLRVLIAAGHAFSFDGDGDYIHFGRSSQWNFLHDGSAFTVTGIVAPAHSNFDGGILSTIDETSTAQQRHGFSLRLDGSRRLEFHIQGVSEKFPVGVKTEAVLRPEVFTAFAVTFDGQTAQLFLNGQLQGSSETVGRFASSTASDALSMGSIGTTSGPNGQPFSPFEGLIDEVQIYNRSLNASEIAFLSAQDVVFDPKVINVAASTFFAPGGAADGTSSDATHSGRGMSTDFPTFPATHSADPTDGFLTASSYSASLHYDFGTPRTVGQIRLWNYHGAAYGDEGNGRGAKDIRVYGSNVAAAFHEDWHDSWELLTAFTASRAPADGAISPYGEEHRFDDHQCRFIRLQVDTNYGGSNVGLAEVQFLNSKAQP